MFPKIHRECPPYTQSKTIAKFRFYVNRLVSTSKCDIVWFSFAHILSPSLILIFSLILILRFSPSLILSTSLIFSLILNPRLILSLIVNFNFGVGVFPLLSLIHGLNSLSLILIFSLNLSLDSFSESFMVSALFSVLLLIRGLILSVIYDLCLISVLFSVLGLTPSFSGSVSFSLSFLFSFSVSFLFSFLLLAPYLQCNWFDSSLQLTKIKQKCSVRLKRMTKLTCKMAIPTPIPPMTAIFPFTKSCNASEQP